MQALDVICILSFDEPVMRRGQNEYTEFKENLHLFVTTLNPTGGEVRNCTTFLVWAK